MQSVVKKALKTWYPKDHELHSNPTHPAVKLAGEAGELLDLYAKHIYKPGFNWWYCKNCKETTGGKICKHHMPLVIEEIGDIWYYLRILAYILKTDLDCDYSLIEHFSNDFDDKTDLLVSLNFACAMFASDLIVSKMPDDTHLKIAYCYLQVLVRDLGYSLSMITDINYKKLNSDPTNHGWAGA